MNEKVRLAKLSRMVYNATVGNPYRDPATGRYTSGGVKSEPKKTDGKPKPRPYKDASGTWVFGIPPHLRGTEAKPPEKKKADGEPKPRPYKDATGKWVYGIPPHLRAGSTKTESKKTDDGKPKPRPYKDANGKWVFGIPPHLRGAGTKTEVKPKTTKPEQKAKPAEPKVKKIDDPSKMSEAEVDAIYRVRIKVGNEVYNFTDEEYAAWDKLSSTGKRIAMGKYFRGTLPEKLNNPKARFGEPSRDHITITANPGYEHLTGRIQSFNSQLESSFPGLKRLADNKHLAVSLLDEDNFAASRGEGWQKIAGTYYDSGKMILRADYLNMVDSTPGYHLGTGSHAVDLSFYGTYRHELGHHVHANLMWTDAKHSVTRRSEWENLWEIYGHRDYVSDYSKTNSMEFFAECFTAYTHPNYKSEQIKLPTDIHNYFKEVLS